MKLSSGEIDRLVPGPNKAFTKGENGVWTLTVAPLLPGIYEYAFDVDGVSMADPSSPNVVGNVRGARGTVEVPGPTGSPRHDEWRPTAHGSVTMHWYDSKATGTRRLSTSTRRRATARRQRSTRCSTSCTAPATTTRTGRPWPRQRHRRQPPRRRQDDAMVIAMTDGHAYRPQQGEQGGGEGAEDVRGRPARRRRAARREGLSRRDRPRLPAIAGLSMGGAQTLNVGLGHADRFAWIGAFSAAVIGVDAKVTALAASAAAFNKGSRLLWLRIGKDDFLLQQNRALVESLKKAGIVHDTRNRRRPHVGRVAQGARRLPAQAVQAGRCRAGNGSATSAQAHRDAPPAGRCRTRRAATGDGRQFGRGSGRRAVACSRRPSRPSRSARWSPAPRARRARRRPPGGRRAAPARRSPPLASPHPCPPAARPARAARPRVLAVEAGQPGRGRWRTSASGSRVSAISVGTTPGPVRSHRLRATAARTLAAAWLAARHNVAVRRRPACRAPMPLPRPPSCRILQQRHQHGFGVAGEGEARIETELAEHVDPSRRSGGPEIGTTPRRPRTRRGGALVERVDQVPELRDLGVRGDRGSGGVRQQRGGRARGVVHGHAPVSKAPAARGVPADRSMKRTVAASRALWAAETETCYAWKRGSDCDRPAGGRTAIPGVRFRCRCPGGGARARKSVRIGTAAGDAHVIGLRLAQGLVHALPGRTARRWSRCPRRAAERGQGLPSRDPSNAAVNTPSTFSTPVKSEICAHSTSSVPGLEESRMRAM